MTPVVVAVLLAAGLVGCAQDDHNEPDVAFTQDMLVHHAQALELTAIAEERGVSPDVARVVAAIEEAQASEVSTMQGWLSEWDMSPDVVADTAAMEDMPGMATAGQLEGLDGLDQAAFERRWLELMIEHHEGAIAMAEEEVDRGSFGPPRDLAREVVRSQAEEIERMRALLAERSG